MLAGEDSYFRRSFERFINNDISAVDTGRGKLSSFVELKSEHGRSVLRDLLAVEVDVTVSQSYEALARNLVEAGNRRADGEAVAHQHQAARGLRGPHRAEVELHE